MISASKMAPMLTGIMCDMMSVILEGALDEELGYSKMTVELFTSFMVKFEYKLSNKSGKT